MIKDSVLCKATLDREHFVNPDLLNQAVSTGTIEHLDENVYRIPMRIPGVMDMLCIHGRSLHTKDTPAFVLKGVGGCWFSRVAFRYTNTTPYFPIAFQGGATIEYLAEEVEYALQLRQAFNECQNDRALSIAKSYGVTEDVFINPVALFSPLEVPVKIKEVEMWEHRKAMELAEVPDKIANAHRVYLYQALMPERLPEFGDAQVWNKCMRIMGCEKHKFKEEALRRAAASYAVVNHLLHRRLGKVCTVLNVGGIYQDSNFHNINLLMVFDYDIISTPEGKTMEELVKVDNDGAIRTIKHAMRLLGVSGNISEKAEEMFYNVYAA
ncbi:hypothetical protein HY486_03085 [Candidatus Woesearchaeota archaeon]|nr:hypothetical protein [Candidatus Woesearchaeota archaeon]